MRVLAAMVLALLLCASPARAQEDAARAGSLFHEAEEAFADSDFLDALRLFRAAYDAAPHPTVRFHVARCLEQLGRLREAWSEMTEVAATAGLTDAQRRDAIHQVDRLRGLLVTLRVEGAPTGASVQVDGAAMCTLPCEVPVDPGDHEVSIEDARGRASAHVSGLRGATVVVPLTILAAPRDDAASASTESSATIETTREPSVPPPHAAGVGWLLVTGSIVAAAGAGGLIGFGLHASDLHAAYLDDPTAALRNEGMTFVDLTNASIAVLGAGAVLMVIDLVLAAVGEGTGDRAALDTPWRF